MTYPRRLLGPALAAPAILALVSCDNRQAFQVPEASLERMLVQKRADAFEATSAFPDGKVMQAPPRNTVPIDDDTDAPAPPMTPDLLRLGHARFDAICAVCHGITGNGESVVATKMELRPPRSLLDEGARRFTRAHIYRVATEGYGLMAGYADMLSRHERWAVAAYVQALQLSQRAPVAQLPPDVRDQLAREAR